METSRRLLQNFTFNEVDKTNNRIVIVDASTPEQATQDTATKSNEPRTKATYKASSEQNMKWDILYEHQRGAFIFGIPKFSAKTLFQLDPAPWTTGDLKGSPVDVTSAQLPDPTWEWVHPEWLVDMSGDVDEEGWEYAFIFRGNYWHGRHYRFRSFVRRRRWVRMRRKKTSREIHVILSKARDPEAEGQPDVKDEYDDDGQLIEGDDKSGYFNEDERRLFKSPSEAHGLIPRLKIARLDREKVQITSDWIDGLVINGDDKQLHTIHGQLPRVLTMFDYHHSRVRILRHLLSTSRHFESCEIIMPSVTCHPDAGDVDDAIEEVDPDAKVVEQHPLQTPHFSRLAFFSDVRDLLKLTEKSEGKGLAQTLNEQKSLDKGKSKA